MRVTKSQKTIMSQLREMGGEISAQELHLKLRGLQINMGLATIYRTLKTLHLEGFIQERITSTGESLYSIIDENEHHAHHLNCVRCGNSVIIDTCPIDKELIQWCKSQKFTVYYHTLEFFGICPKCRLYNEVES